ncbi:hypothetical protein Q4E93_23495 [Flavitalea sp. BT771]|uniref:hypothetical protein n=1 Tax=Flavitalea sp. BT771 TaxID=3063329 RepID=UPI0026E22E44|nr:hypothetical protein [Flavitalea sp. BT771]MDO6433596.1 hypothetical protein [Flavitalea sp. BT771]MDV6222499.1 hypothetical protein [Flavitalea sp. BT771]
MKKLFIPVVAIATFSFMYSCKGKNKDASSDAGTTQEPAKKDETKAAPTNEPKTYTVTFSPDTVLLGKNKEAFIKIKNAKAIALQNPDGKDEGIELTFDLDVTNKNKVGGHNFFFSTSNFRLTLDNNQNITEADGNSSGVDAESTKEIAGIKYKIPAGAKPKTLNLFHDETRASVGVELK